MWVKLAYVPQQKAKQEEPTASEEEKKLADEKIAKSTD